MNDDFAPRLLSWFDQHGRHDLPWQHPRSAYRVWISEIMLQQTQVATVIGYFDRFITAFPDLQSLAAASLDQVLAHWAGLGYYSRARNLHRAAQICVDMHAGSLPRDLDALRALPGIGRSTAAAILSQAHAERVAILDGNVKRVLSRHAGIEGYPGLPAVERQLWREAESRLPDAALAARMPDYTQALMDLGASVCARRQPRCTQCPIASDCVAFHQDRTAELPTRKPRRDISEKSVRLLIAIDDAGRILLHKRPPIGIWGGLWSLPELSPIAPVDEYHIDELNSDDEQPTPSITGLLIKTLRPMPTMQHRFTHFLLHIQPSIAHASADPNHVNETPEQRWVDPETLHQYGLPAPIRVLLEQYSTKKRD